MASTICHGFRVYAPCSSDAWNALGASGCKLFFLMMSLMRILWMIIGSGSQPLGISAFLNLVVLLANYGYRDTIPFQASSCIGRELQFWVIGYLPGATRWKPHCSEGTGCNQIHRAEPNGTGCNQIHPTHSSVLLLGTESHRE